MSGFDENLHTIAEQLNDIQVKYWVDSGTLLGMVRNRSLLEGDWDIDIGTVYDDVEKIQKLEDKLGNKYTVSKYMYHGNIHKIKFSKDSERTIDINIFRKEGDYLWCPAIKRSHDINSTILNTLARIYKIIYRKKDVWESKDPVIDRITADPKTWVYPKKYFEPHLGNLYGFPIPNSPEKYLEYRYGEWQVPDPEWNYWEDDNALIEVPPEEFCDRFSIV